jgi:membrane glycosyltransferase
MFVGVAAFVLFVILAAIAAVAAAPGAVFPIGSALVFYIVWYVMFITPKLAGIADAALRSPARYGGLRRLLLGGAVETFFSTLLTTISNVGQTLFMTALLFGRAITWDEQRRDRYRLAWSEAAKVFWPHTLFAVLLLALLAFGAPNAVLWFLPFLLGPALSIPFAVVTASPSLGALAAERRFCAIPEEFVTPPELAAIIARQKS